MKRDYGREFKELVDKESYKLLEEYTNNKTKVKIRCDEGHEYSVIPNNFKSGQRCPVCPRKDSVQAGKEFKELVESVGYELLEEYKGAHVKVKIRCKYGHEYKVRPNDFKNNGSRCPVCADKCPIQAKKDFIELVESVGYELIGEYKNNSTKVKIKCNKGHEYKVRPNSFKSGNRCPECSGNCPKQAGEKFKELVESVGYELLEEYKGSLKKVKIRCPEGHEYKVIPSSFKNNGSRCPICSKCCPIQAKKDFIELLESVGYELLEEYKGSLKKVKIRCKYGHEYKVRPNDFKNNGNRCPICFESRSQKEINILNYVKSILKEEVIISGDRTNVINPITGNYLELDIWIPRLRKAIEFNGTFWHSGDYSKIKDNIKVEYCEDNDIDLMVIDEIEYDTGLELCLSSVDNFLGIEKSLYECIFGMG